LFFANLAVSLGEAVSEFLARKDATVDFLQKTLVVAKVGVILLPSRPGKSKENTSIDG